MADTRAQAEVEKWVRTHWMPAHFGHEFRKARIQLTAGGFFEFDAVSKDNSIVASISTSKGITSGGKYPVGKVHKLRADVLFLTMASAQRRLMVLTEPDMHAICQKEAMNGRLPKGVEYVLVEIPSDLAAQCNLAREQCSIEVRPAPKAV